MSLLVRGVGGFPSAAVALASVIWGLSGPSAMAQGGGVGAGSTGGPGGRYVMIDPGYGGTAYGVAGVPSGFHGAPPGVYGPGYGTFGPGYPGFGLEYGSGCGSSFPLLHRQLRRASIHTWGANVLGKECLYPYVADPYSDPRAAMGFWPPYSAPVAGAAR